MANEKQESQNAEMQDIQTAKQISDLQKELDRALAKIKKLEQNQYVVETRDSFNLEKWRKKDTFLGRMMFTLLTYKDVSTRITEDSIFNACQCILRVALEANKLKAEDKVIRFADQYLDLSEVMTLNIFSGAFVINEVSDDFDTLNAKRYTVKSVLPLGIDESVAMPTIRAYKESLHLIKSLFKYMNEEFISLSVLHNTSNVANMMKDCAHKDKFGKFTIARRASNDLYFIPYYVEEFNDILTWKDEYYNDDVEIYICEYFDKFVYPVLKGKK